MNENAKKYLDYAHYPWIKGPFLGASMMLCITPLLKWSNLVLKGDKFRFFPISAHMSGGSSYAFSVIPGYAMTFGVKSILNDWQASQGMGYQLTSSFLAGGVSGFASVPFENIAQNKQLSGLVSNQAILKQIMLHHGFTGMLQGSLSIIAREGLWACVYLTAIPHMVKYLVERDYGSKEATLVASLIVAGSFGLISSPLELLRFKKQEGLCFPKSKASYWSCWQEIWQDSSRTKEGRLGFFFKRSFPRMVTTTCGGAFMLKATETYDQVLKP